MSLKLRIRRIAASLIAMSILSAPALRASAQDFVDLSLMICPEQGGTTSPQTLTVPQGTRSLKLHVELEGGTDDANSAAREYPDYECVLTPVSYSNPSFSVHVMNGSGETLYRETFPPIPSSFIVKTCGIEPEGPPLRTKVEVRTIDLGDLAANGDANVTVESDVCLDVPALPSRASTIGGRLSANNTPLLGVFSNDEGLGEQRGDLYAAQPSQLAITVTAAPVAQAGEEPTPGQTIRVALGQPFGWGMVRKGTNEPVECTFALDYVAFDPDNPIVDDSANYPGRTVTLFKDQVLLPFGFDQPRTRVTMVGLHLGTQYFRATPTDGKTRAAIVKVEVKPPHALGQSPNDLDDEIVEVANRRGIPPQWIKGNIKKEARSYGQGGFTFWDRETWRYEPLSIDLDEISRGNNLRTKSPYRRYRLATQTDDPPPDGLTQGADLTQADIDYRSVLFIERAGTRRAVASTDADVTVRELVDANKWQNWQKVNRRRYNAADAERRATGIDPLAFNAQTTLATSYGLIQPMYANAIRFSRWHDPFGPGTAVVNPSLLMDTPENLEAGEGSLHVATVQLLYLYNYTSSGGFAQKFGQPAYPIDRFASFAEFEDSWRKSLRFYNVGMTDYADTVLKNAESYQPSRTDAGIQQGAQ